ncbi:DUF3237 domain-containing protein [Agilicoccus flavus]|uniref:DUF3237 domain-containing protein n=1 Tax=Agilicoccus flavus TaxID=2775968 RepID=UPI001CF6370D|nr:DUF3237 domain-containing protein [Agilicoccus flavus]
MERRTALTGGLAAVAALGTVATGAGRAGAARPASGATDAARRHPPAPTPAEFDALVRTHPAAAPAVEFAFAAVVDVAEAESMGVGPLGERRIVPILGGRFAGPRIAGTVVPGGADRQLVRADGVRLLSAQYELRTDDGAYISVLNNVLIHGDGPDRYARSTIEMTAPTGPHDWINRRRFVGTLTSLRPDRAAVLIRFYALV